jgi:hypothetical protein
MTKKSLILAALGALVLLGGCAILGNKEEKTHKLLIQVECPNKEKTLVPEVLLT